jgi:hypothetical protein
MLNRTADVASNTVVSRVARVNALDIRFPLVRGESESVGVERLVQALERRPFFTPAPPASWFTYVAGWTAKVTAAVGGSW